MNSPSFKPRARKAMLQEKPEAFRQECIDQFARSVTVGGSFHIIFACASGF